MLGIIQIIIAVLLTVVILMQSKGSGLGGIFGGEGNVYKSKRGLDKSLMVATIVLAVIFIGLAIVGMFVI
ncbi:preprotein translocase subunit SecG [Patescibacteria group bacterium]|nr:MAG: preprotein translocase subunit SecG [Patescibacteria group bacterium]